MTELIRSTRDVIIRTPHAKAAADFYQQVLGLAVTQRFGEIVGFETGTLQLFVEQGDALPAIPRCYLRSPFGLTFNLGQR